MIRRDTFSPTRLTVLVALALVTAATGDDGDLSRSDVLTVVERFTSGQSVNGVDFTREAVLALVRYYVRQ